MTGPISEPATCPYCGAKMQYRGIDDGGDYGTSVCDIFECVECQHEIEMNCIDMEFEDDEPEEWGYDFSDYD